VSPFTARPHRWAHREAQAVEHDMLRTELAALDESIRDRRPSALLRAELLAARKRVYETLHPSSRHGGAPGRAGGGKAPRNQRSSPPVRSHAADAALRTGLSERSIRQLVQIAEGIPASLRDLIRDTPLARRQRVLLQVARARRDPAEQHRRVRVALGARSLAGA